MMIRGFFFNRSWKTVSFLMFFLILGGGIRAEMDDSVLVETVGEGRAPLESSQDIAAARRIALMAAKRDAVEKAFGAYVNLEKDPDRERIYSSSMAVIKEYVMEEEREEKGYYYTRIRAMVPVPKKFIQPQDSAEENPAEGFQPLVEEFIWGEINWEEGYITAKGEGRVNEAGDPDQARLNAKRAAEVDARGNMLKIIFNIRVDADSTVGEKAEKKDISYKLEGFIRGAEIIHEEMLQEKGRYSVTLKAPIHGVRGLSSFFFDESMGDEAQATSQEKAAASGKTYTIIVFDARGTGLHPSLFPRILDRDGKEVYSIRKVWKTSALERGMAAYAVLESGQSILPSGGIDAPGGRTPILQNCMNESEHSFFIQARTSPQKDESRTRRRGFNPVVVDTDATAGKLATNLIISNEDARKLENIDGETNLLKDCRVLIIKESAVGGVEGLLIAGMTVRPFSLQNIPDR